jgi:phospholipid/cholesterol/gamma-HCH transport system ATP-binding protein
LIRLTDTGKRFDGDWVFRGVSLEVEAGSSIAILGPSGSGKSTLLRLIAGLLTPDEGSVVVDNSNVGMLFQRNALFDSLTVEENLLFPLRERTGLTGAPARDRAREYLSSVGLAGTEALFPDELSGGMQKRLGIARALIVSPEVVLYDDPTAGLDPITSRMIAELINDLRRSSGTTVVAVTNDPHRAYQLGERIFLLKDGGLIAGGTPDQARSNADARVRNFLFGLSDERSAQ